MKKYKGIIFDLDGTLLNTIDDLTDSVNSMLEYFGCPTHSNNEYKLKVGKGFRNLIENSFPEGTDINTIEKGLNLFVENYDNNYQNKTAPYDGINELLDKLNDMGILMGVNSNKRDDYSKSLISKFFDRIPFTVVYGERSHVGKKPDPTTALEIAQMMALGIDELLYIGDSKTDIQTAKNANIDSVGVLWGFRSLEELKKYKADYIVANPEEILKLFVSEV